MKRDSPWMLAVSLVWVAFGIFSTVRGDSSQAAMNFGIGAVFAILGANHRKHSSKA
jgi:hypothetical protein